jgi:hypothetical protein
LTLNKKVVVIAPRSYLAQHHHLISVWVTPWFKRTDGNNSSIVCPLKYLFKIYTEAFCFKNVSKCFHKSKLFAIIVAVQLSIQHIKHELICKIKLNSFSVNKGESLMDIPSWHVQSLCLALLRDIQYWKNIFKLTFLLVSFRSPRTTLFSASDEIVKINYFSNLIWKFRNTKLARVTK